MHAVTLQFKTNTEPCSELSQVHELASVSQLFFPPAGDCTYTPHFMFPFLVVRHKHISHKDIAGSRAGAYLPTSYVYMHASCYNGQSCIHL